MRQILRRRVVHCLWAAALALAPHAVAAATAPPQAAICAACHGANGMGNAAAGYPALAGLPAPYLEQQLLAFRQGTRKNALMTPMAATLTEAQRQALGVYYAALPVAATAEPNPLPGGPGAVLATDGARDGKLAGLPACDSCHGPQGIGVGSAFPRLAGQPKAYLAAQLAAWQKGERSTDPLQLMHNVAARLSAAQIEAVTAYFSSLPANPASLDAPSAAMGDKQ